jgi:hypothetical protein
VDSLVTSYLVDNATLVQIEVDAPDDFVPAGTGSVAGRVRDAIGPAVDAAKIVLDKVKEIKPHEVELKFGVKVSGGASWLIAKSAAEGNFEITLKWSPENAKSKTSSDSHTRVNLLARESEKNSASDENSGDGRTDWC